MLKLVELKVKPKYVLGNHESACGLRRIIALRSFGDVKAGDIGGWVAGYHNLSHTGDCWIYDDAEVHGNAYVCQNAIVMHEAKMYGRAVASGNAVICGDAIATGNVRIGTNAILHGSEYADGDGVLTGYPAIVIRH